MNPFILFLLQAAASLIAITSVFIYYLHFDYRTSVFVGLLGMAIFSGLYLVISPIK